MNDKNSPPKNLDELRALLTGIQGGTSDTQLGARSFETLASIVDAPRQAAVYSISELAAMFGVNASTLTRLAKRLGYNGFSDFQNVFRRHIADDRGYYSEKAGRLISSEEFAHQSLNILNRVAEDEQVNVASLLGEISHEVLDSTANLLAQANAIRFHGLRHFFSIACFMSYGLGMIKNNVEVLGDSGHGVAHSLARLSAGDVVVVLGSQPYTLATVEAARIAAKHDLRTVAITDTYASPLAGFAEKVFVVPTGGTYYGNNTAAWIILAEGLLTLVARRLGQNAISELKKREMFFDEMGVSFRFDRGNQ